MSFYKRKGYGPEDLQAHRTKLFTEMRFDLEIDAAYLKRLASVDRATQLALTVPSHPCWTTRNNWSVDLSISDHSATDNGEEDDDGITSDYQSRDDDVDLDLEGNEENRVEDNDGIITRSSQAVQSGHLGIQWLVDNSSTALFGYARWNAVMT